MGPEMGLKRRAREQVRWRGRLRRERSHKGTRCGLEPERQLWSEKAGVGVDGRLGSGWGEA